MFGRKPKNQPIPPVSLNPTPVMAGPLGMSPEPAPAAEENNSNAKELTTKTEANPMIESDLTTSVSRNTIFTGDIVSEDNVEIFGEVKGCVTSRAIAKIHGKVDGDVTCGVLVAGNANIVGNIICEKSAVFGNDTNVNGNVVATVVTISGQINGNIKASESVSVSSTGAVYGDISTPEIEVSKGAIVFGSVVMEQPPALPQIEEPAAPEKEPEKEKESEKESDKEAEPAPAIDGPKEEASRSNDNSHDNSRNEIPLKTESASPRVTQKQGNKKKGGRNPFSLEENG